MLRGIFGAKRDEATGEWRRLHDKELYDLTPHQHFSVIKPRRMRWAGHVARMGIEDAYTGFWWGNLRERDPLEEPGVGEIILRGIFRKWDVAAWIGPIWLSIGTGGGHL